MSGPVVRVVFGGVSTFKSRGVGARYFSSFLMLRIICVRYRTAICEKVFIGLLILYCGILKSKRFLMDGVGMEPLVHVMMMIGMRTRCASSGCGMMRLLSLRVVPSSRNL